MMAHTEDAQHQIFIYTLPRVFIKQHEIYIEKWVTQKAKLIATKLYRFQTHQLSSVISTFVKIKTWCVCEKLQMLMSSGYSTVYFILAVVFFAQ